jgi:hypothetical protein
MSLFDLIMWARKQGYIWGCQTTALRVIGGDLVILASIQTRQTGASGRFEAASVCLPIYGVIQDIPCWRECILVQVEYS